jgi:hypothetical protein
MLYEPSSLWLAPLEDAEKRLDTCLGRSAAGARVFFRADDVGAPGKRFSGLMDLFRRQKAPLSLAVVPVWLSATRAEVVCRDSLDPELFCWHQHGFRHKNHEKTGKKAEFGESRSQKEIFGDLARGMERLYGLLGEAFFPVFTPPWNRCGEKTYSALKELGFQAVSGFQGKSTGRNLVRGDGLRGIPVNVDLHTRKEENPPAAWDGLFRELGAALEGGLCGVMIHHQRMNGLALDFLELLIRRMRESGRVRLAHLGHLAGEPENPVGEQNVSAVLA